MFSARGVARVSHWATDIQQKPRPRDLSGVMPVALKHAGDDQGGIRPSRHLMVHLRLLESQAFAGHGEDACSSMCMCTQADMPGSLPKHGQIQSKQ